MTTHVFNRKVYIKGDCVVPLGPDNNMYVSLPETFCLDRSSDDKNVFMEKMDEMIQIYNRTEQICFDDKKIYLLPKKLAV